MSKKKKLIAIISTSVALLLVVAFALIYFLAILPPIREKRAHEQAVKEYFEYKMNQYVQENSFYQDGEVDVCFLGDSLTDGYDLDKYYPQFLTVNRGIGGDTTTRLLDRLQVSIYDLQPKIAVVLIGGNNLNTMFNDYELIIKGIKQNAPNTKIVLLSLTAMGKEYKEKNAIATLNNVRIQNVAKENGCHYVDLFSSLYDFNTCELYADYTVDGAHLNDKGYVVLTSLVTPVLSQLLA